MFPNNDIFLRKFSSYYVPRILKFCRMKKEYLLQKVDDFDDGMTIHSLVILLNKNSIFSTTCTFLLYVTDTSLYFTDNFKALILLPELLPSPNYAKTKTTVSDSKIIFDFEIIFTKRACVYEFNNINYNFRGKTIQKVQKLKHRIFPLNRFQTEIYYSLFM